MHRVLPMSLLLALLSRFVLADTAIPEKTLAEVKAATVFIKVSGASGSGFLMDRDKDRGVVVTNAHVAHPNGRTPSLIQCVFHSGSKEEFTVPARLISADDSRDLAILEVKHENLPKELDVEPKLAVRETLPVFVIGFPYGELLETSARRGPAATISRATVSSVRRDEYDNVAVVQVDGGVNPGNSGGPVVDSSGALVGIAVAKVSGTQIGFAIPGRDLAEMLQGRVGSVSVRKYDDKSGKSSFEMRVELIDPMSKIRNVQILTFPRTEMKGIPRPDDRGQWQPIGNILKSTTLPVEGGVASGKVTLPPDSKPGNDFVFQIRYTRGDRQIRLTAPTPLAEKAAASTASIARPSSSVSPLRPRSPSEPREGVSGTIPLRSSGKLYTAGLQPPQLQESPVEKRLPGVATNVVLGGGGRYIVLHFADSRTVGIFDINQADLVKTIEVASDAVVAATVDKMFIVSPFAAEIEIWKLAEFAENKEFVKEKTAKLPFAGTVKAIAAGHASRGPVLVHWARGTGALSNARYSLLDANSLRPLRVDGVETGGLNGRGARPTEAGAEGEFGLRNGGVYRDDVRIRASANGQVFGMWCVSHSPSGLESVLIGDRIVQDIYEHESVGHVVPTADGSAICTNSGYYSADLARKRGNEQCLPTGHPSYALVFSSDGGSQGGTSSRAGQMFGGSSSSRNRPGGPTLPQQGTIVDDGGRTAAQLPELPEMDGSMSLDFQKGLSLDQRYLCLPQVKLLVTIPPSNDKLVLRTIDIDAVGYDAVDPRSDRGSGEALTTASASGREARTWNDKSGKFSIVATFQSFEGGQVKLKKEDGTVVSVPVEKLCDADTEYIRSQNKK